MIIWKLEVPWLHLGNKVQMLDAPPPDELSMCWIDELSGN